MLAEHVDFFVRMLLTELVNGESVGVLSLYFQRIFDTLSYRRLATKIKTHGIRDNIFAGIMVWLTVRKHRVDLNVPFSRGQAVTIRLPQRTVLMSRYIPMIWMCDHMQYFQVCRQQKN